MNEENVKSVCICIIVCVSMIMVLGIIWIFFISNSSITIKMDNNTANTMIAFTSVANRMLDKNLTMETITVNNNISTKTVLVVR